MFDVGAGDAGGAGGDGDAGGAGDACMKDILKGIYFFQNLVWPSKPLLARSLGSLAVGERATFYLDQSSLC